MSEAAFPRYAPRHMAALGLWEIHRWRFKAYGIRLDAPPHDGPFLPVELCGAARSAVEGLTPEMERTSHCATGFIVLHAGEDANWLLTHWWTDASICSQIMLFSRPADPLIFGRVEEPNMACVWELVPVEHERRAWVENVLTRIGGVDAYLGRWMKDGTY